MAERGRFELPIALRLCLISSQVHSTGLCHLSAGPDRASCTKWFCCAEPPGLHQSTGKRMSMAMPAVILDLCPVEWRRKPALMGRFVRASCGGAAEACLGARQLSNAARGASVWAPAARWSSPAPGLDFVQGFALHSTSRPARTCGISAH